MADIMLVSIALIILLIGTFTDFKTREVPDWVNYSGIFAGLGIRLIYSASALDPSYILSGALGFGVFLGIALAMFYMGQWGGGDSKMLMGLGALMGLEFRPDNIMVAFFVNALIIGAAYGVLWSIILAVKHKKKFVPYMAKVMKSEQYKKSKKALLVIILSIVVLSLVSGYFAAAALLSIALAILFLFYVFIFLRLVLDRCRYCIF